MAGTLGTEPLPATSTVILFDSIKMDIIPERNNATDYVKKPNQGDSPNPVYVSTTVSSLSLSTAMLLAISLCYFFIWASSFV
jgi:hypothetical protein